MKFFEKLTGRLFGLVCLTMIVAFTWSHTAEAKSSNKAIVKLENNTYDFGMINEKGGPVSHEFTFTNEGDGPLVIEDARAECGCTLPEFPEEPIAPGKSGTIKVTYNPLGRPGSFTKVVTVWTNGNPSKLHLKIKGTVKPGK